MSISRIVHRNKHLSVSLLVAVPLLLAPFNGNAQPYPVPTIESDAHVDSIFRSSNPLQESASLVGLYQIGKTSRSNVQFFVSNYGILGLDIRNSQGGAHWPANSGKKYLFAGGFWFGAKKFVEEHGELRKLSVISYNPNTGSSWFTPGRGTSFESDEPIDDSPEGERLNRLYFSTEHNLFTGERNLLPDQYPLWPIWIDPAQGGAPFYTGTFLPDESARESARSNGWSPGVVSSEDFFSIYRDNNLSRYEISLAGAENAGYPIGIEVQSSLYSWGSGDLKDVILLSYTVVNRSLDTLREAWFAPLWDPDIGESLNDRLSIVIPDREADTLAMVQGWTESNLGDVGFGYVGIDLIATPAVDEEGFLRKDRTIHPPGEQIGLKGVKIFTIDQDPKTFEERYDFMASEVFETSAGGRDWRMLLNTGPFTMIPGDTARFVVGILFAEGSGPVPDGTDNGKLVQLSNRLQRAFDNGIRGVSGVSEDLPLEEILRRLNLE